MTGVAPVALALVVFLWLATTRVSLRAAGRRWRLRARARVCARVLESLATDLDEIMHGCPSPENRLIQAMLFTFDATSSSRRRRDD